MVLGHVFQKVEKKQIGENQSKMNKYRQKITLLIKLIQLKFKLESLNNYNKQAPKNDFSKKRIISGLTI
jgi:hypothetical protein